MSKTSTYRILTDAADLIEREGWTQRTYKSQDGCYCLYGAIHTAAGLDRFAVDESDDVLDETWELLAAQTNLNPIHWNDAAGRTKEEVVDLLRTTATTVALT